MSSGQADSGHKVSTVAGSAGPLTLFNGFVLLAGNLAGGLCAVYADLFPASSVGTMRGVLAASFAMGGLLITPWVLSFNEANKTQLGPVGRLQYGYSVMAQRKSFALIAHSIDRGHPFQADRGQSSMRSRTP